MMKTFSAQQADIDHAIKKALILFTKHPLGWPGLQPVRTIKTLSPTGLHIAFFFFLIIVPPIAQVL